jgi:hypothetical protein
MRRAFGAFLFVAAAWSLYQFAVYGAYFAGQARLPETQWVPFNVVGVRYPWDAAWLAVAIWAIALGLALVLLPGRRDAELPAHVPPSSRWAQNLRARQNQPCPMATMFVLNVGLLITMLFMAYVGAKPLTSHPRYVSVFSLVAGLQIGVGLILLILALFEKPRGVQRLVWGGAFYLAGTAASVTIFIWGSPAQA